LKILEAKDPRGGPLALACKVVSLMSPEVWKMGRDSERRRTLSRHVLAVTGQVSLPSGC